MKIGDKVRIVGEQAKKDYPKFAKLEGVVTRVGSHGALSITADFGVVLDSTHEPLGYFDTDELEVVKNEN